MIRFGPELGHRVFLTKRERLGIEINDDSFGLEAEYDRDVA
jgi:hypothetical protein